MDTVYDNVQTLWFFWIDPSKYGAPPSYEEAVSANPQTNAPIQGYTPVQGGVPPYPVNSDGTGGMPYSPYTAYPTSYPTSQYPPQSGYPPTISNTGVYAGEPYHSDVHCGKVT